MFVDLGLLRSFRGSERYAMPSGLDLKGYESVIIWCEQSSLLILPADLMHKGSIGSGESTGPAMRQLARLPVPTRISMGRAPEPLAPSIQDHRVVSRVTPRP